MQELKAIYDTRKTFYGKAQTQRKNGAILLYSYGTLVASIENGELLMDNLTPSNLIFSHTTLRHIKEFIKQFLTLDTMSKKDIEKNALWLDLSSYYAWEVARCFLNG